MVGLLAVLFLVGAAAAGPPPTPVPTTPRAPAALVIAGLAMVKEMVAVKVVKMFLACTKTANVPARVGVPETTPVAPSQLKPEGRPDAEYHVGLLVATIW